jgi:hypothetical protein
MLNGVDRCTDIVNHNPLERLPLNAGTTNLNKLYCTHPPLRSFLI